MTIEEIADRLAELSVIEIPFGEYENWTLHDVPLDCLDEEFSVMRPTWLIRRIREFVDLSMMLSFRKWRMVEVPSVSLRVLCESPFEKPND